MDAGVKRVGFKRIVFIFVQGFSNFGLPHRILAYLYW